jgi:hypothetical protein
MSFNSKQLFKKVPLLGNAPTGFAALLALKISPCVNFVDDVSFDTVESWFCSRLMGI